MKWHIPDMLIEVSHRRAQFSVDGQKPFSKPGSLILYDPHGATNYEFTAAERSQDRTGFIGDRESLDGMPGYIAQAIKPVMV